MAMARSYQIPEALAKFREILDSQIRGEGVEVVSNEDGSIKVFGVIHRTGWSGNKTLETNPTIYDNKFEPEYYVVPEATTDASACFRISQVIKIEQDETGEEVPVVVFIKAREHHA